MPTHDSPVSQQIRVVGIEISSIHSVVPSLQTSPVQQLLVLQSIWAYGEHHGRGEGGRLLAVVEFT